MFCVKMQVLFVPPEGGNVSKFFVAEAANEFSFIHIDQFKVQIKSVKSVNNTKIITLHVWDTLLKTLVTGSDYIFRKLTKIHNT